MDAHVDLPVGEGALHHVEVPRPAPTLQQQPAVLLSVRVLAGAKPHGRAALLLAAEGVTALDVAGARVSAPLVELAAANLTPAPAHRQGCHLWVVVTAENESETVRVEARWSSITPPQGGSGI